MSSVKFDSAIDKSLKVKPQFRAAAARLQELSDRGVRVFDGDTLAKNLGTILTPAEITILMAILLQAGVVYPVLRVRDPQGRLTESKFSQLDEVPEYDDDRFLNRFKVEQDHIEPTYELVQ